MHLYLRRLVLCALLSAAASLCWMEAVGLAPFFGDLEVDRRSGWKLHPSFLSGVNEDGYRGRRLPARSAPGCVRIATLGDSSTYGVGRFLPATTYAGILEKKMKGAGVGCETMNLGVPGYTIVMGVERLKEVVRENDLHVATFRFGYNEGIGSRTNLADSNRRLIDAPFLHSGLAAWSRTLRVVQFTRAQWGPVSPDRPPARVRVPVGEYGEKVRESIVLCREKGIEPIWLEYVALDEHEHLARYNQAAKAVCAQMGAAYVEFPALKALGEAGFIMNRLHPSRQGHERIADEIVQVLLARAAEGGTAGSEPTR